MIVAFIDRFDLDCRFGACLSLRFDRSIDIVIQSRRYVSAIQDTLYVRYVDTASGNTASGASIERSRRLLARKIVESVGWQRKLAEDDDDSDIGIPTFTFVWRFRDHGHAIRLPIRSDTSEQRSDSRDLQGLPLQIYSFYASSQSRIHTRFRAEPSIFANNTHAKITYMP